MKLHLPSSLRKALLSCLAAFAAPVFTLASSSAALSAAALAGLAVAPQVSAAGDTSVDEEEAAVALQTSSGDYWVWSGEGSTSNADDSANWSGNVDFSQSAQANAAFDSGVGNQEVTLPHMRFNSAIVRGGQYIFHGSADASAGGFDLAEGLIIGGEGEQASAELRGAHANIPKIEVRAQGALVISSAAALATSAGGSTTIYVDRDGLLAYGDAESGALLFSGDLSSYISAADTSGIDRAGALNIRIGRDSAAFSSENAPASATVVWGSTGADTLTEGVRRVLEAGVVKSGHGALEVDWRLTKIANYNYPTNKILVTDGRLVFKPYAAVISAACFGTPNDSTLAPIEVRGNGSVQFMIDGDSSLSGYTFTLTRPFAGDGTAIIGGKEDGNVAAYALYANNAGFNGTIELQGKSNAKVVTVAKLSALQGRLLRFNGRGISFSSSTKNDLVDGVMHVGMDVEVVGGTVNYIGGYNQVEEQNACIEFSGALSGSGTLGNCLTMSHRLSGNISAFTGTLFAQATTTKWSLVGASLVDADVQANYSGQGVIIVQAAGAGAGDAVRLTGQFKDTVSLENTMEHAKVVIGGAKNTSTGRLLLHGNVIQLGDDTVAGSWAGSELQATGGGSFVLTSGDLKHAITQKGGATLSVVTGATNATSVNAGGTMGSLLDSVTINAGGHLSGVSGNMVAGTGEGQTQFTLVLDSRNIGKSASAQAGDYLIELAKGATLDLGDGSGFTIDFAASSVVDILTGLRNKDENGSDGRAFLHILTGGALDVSRVDMSKLLYNCTKEGIMGQLFSALGFRLDSSESYAGDLVLTGSSQDVHLVLGSAEGDDAKSDAHLVTADNKADFESNVAIVIGPQAELEIRLDSSDSITVHNLVGVGTATLRGVNATPTEGQVTIKLDNTYVDKAEFDMSGLEHAGVTSEKQLRGQDTTFEGSIIGERGVTFEKTGKGVLTVGSRYTGKGGLQIAGSLTLSEGGLAVQGARDGAGNTINELVFAYAAAQDTAHGETTRGLTLAYGSTTVHSIAERSAAGCEAGHTIHLQNSGELIYTGSGALHSTTFKGDGSGTLTIMGSTSTDYTGLVIDSAAAPHAERISGVQLQVASNGKLTLTGGAIAATAGDSAVQSGGSLVLAGGSGLQANGGLSLQGSLILSGGSKADIAGLSGAGSLVGDAAASARVTVRGTANSFSGAFEQSGTLTIAQGAALSLQGATQQGPGSWALHNSGALTIEASGSSAPTTRLGHLHLASGSQTTLIVDTDATPASSLALESFGWDTGASFTLQSVGARAFTDSAIDLGVLSGELTGIEPGIGITLSGVAFLHCEAGHFYQEGDRLMLGIEVQQVNAFRAINMSKNVIAGADMFWNASSPTSQAWLQITSDIFLALRSDLYLTVNELITLHDQGKTAELSKSLAAGAGASTAILGSALAQDIRRQLSAIRNRTTTMGNDERFDSYDEAPFYHMWVNGESSYHKLDDSGLAPGYSLNSWGGTLGADADLSQSATVGLALTAMCGSLKSAAADSATGSVDTTYLSAFARVAEGAWLHTFVAAAGKAQVKLNRTVSAGAHTYTAHGNTSGYTFGALYELGHATITDSQGSYAVQSVLNVEYRHAALSGYSESGTDAGLRVGSTSYSVVTIGAGLRAQSIVGENSYNRTSILEARTLVKVDMGDHSGRVHNSLINGDGTTRELESARHGAVGLELGTGLTIPLGSSSGALFLDASLDLRSSSTSLDAAAGYRISF